MLTKQKNFVSAVIYTRNAESTIKEFLINLYYDVLVKYFEDFEIICVNDASTDRTTEILKDLAKELKSCAFTILNMSYHQGLESSMSAGMDLAIGDFVIEFDSIVIDYSPNLIIEAYERTLQGFDIVSCGKGSVRTSSRLFYMVFNRFSGAEYVLRSESFRVISRRGINRVNSMSTSILYRKAAYAKSGLKLDYIAYEGSANDLQLLKHPQDTAINALMLFSDVAYRLSFMFTFLMMIVTIAVTAYVLVIGMLGLPIAGWATTMLLISGLFFALFVILAIIIKYLSLILKLIFVRQRYVIESIEKIKSI